jgi:phosphoglycolate phosphatase-like HAD superfamily hydrolase
MPRRPFLKLGQSSRLRPHLVSFLGFCFTEATMLKAVIFDIDGTLIDSVDLHARSWVDAFARFGVEVKFEDVRRHIGEGADRLIPAFVPPGMPNDKQKKIEEFRSKSFKRNYLDKIKPFPNVKELFGRIKAEGCKVLLASSCAADEIDQYKAIAGITGMTDHDVTADDAGSSKPSPDIFLQALERLAPIDSSQTCVVGDTKYDGEAARRAGVPFLGLLCGGSSKDELERSGAVATYRDPTELLNNWSCWRELSLKRKFSAAS